MAQNDPEELIMKPEVLVFLDSSGCIQVTAFFCDCAMCRVARDNPPWRRTRAGLAVLGSETVLSDASPDLVSQLEGEGIQRVGRIFITHWPADHISGLGELAEPASVCKWPKIDNLAGRITYLDISIVIK